MATDLNARPPVEPQWDASSLPDLSGKIAVVTGGGSGIGFETALQLARHGAHVVIACHIEAQGTEAQNRILDAVQSAPIQGGKAEFMHLDVSRPESVKGFAARFKATFDRLDILVNNAYVILPPYTVTDDGFELQFATNYLGHFVLVSQLIDVMKRNPSQARIVNVGSMLHRRVSFHDDDLVVSDAAAYSPLDVYAKTKLYMSILAFELQRRFDREQIANVIALVAHPGVVTTKVAQVDFTPLGLTYEIASKYMHPPENGALPILYGAASADAMGGDYLAPDGPLEISGYPSRQVPSAFALSEEYGQQLWAASEKMAQLQFDL